HYTCWARESSPQIRVDKTAINRDPGSGTSFAPIVKKVAPSVVNIFSTRFIRERPRYNPFFNDPIFRQFFGDPEGGDNREHMRKEESLGSGVIVSPDGYILTANHVVADADEVKVSIGDDKKEYPAKIIGKDAATDVAVLKIGANNLPAITLADSDQLEVGDVVLAIGDPFGVGQTVTKGIVSALGRSFEDDDQNQPHIQNFIQTDAAINPGNSGGALVDAEGRLVGINTAIISPSGGNNGIGFAVPVNMARTVLERLLVGGKVIRGYLGVLPEDLNPGLAQQFGLSDQNGALVGYVLPGSPADKAGILSGDVIVSLNDRQITGADNLKAVVSQLDPGSKASLGIIRDGVARTVVVPLGTSSESGGAPDDQNDSNIGSSKTDALDGVTVADLDTRVRSQLRLPDNIHGAIVTEVDSDSNSADAGLQPNDVIVEINHHAVNDSDDAVRLCKAAKGDQILVKIWRHFGNAGGTEYLSVDNTKRPQ
ncbi:MAG: Do family serine endopeptidase, partial [Verrucomicrobiota bacterium]